jgi:hypothetical protein
MDNEPKNNQSETKKNSIVLGFLNEAIQNKNKVKVREMVDYIQKIIEEGGLHCSPMPDNEIDELIKTGKGTIYVGSGTSGQRVFIEDGGLRMPYNSEKDEELGKRYHNNFRYLFDVPEGEDLIVK